MTHVYNTNYIFSFFFSFFFFFFLGHRNKNQLVAYDSEIPVLFFGSKFVVDTGGFGFRRFFGFPYPFIVFRCLLIVRSTARIFILFYISPKMRSGAYSHSRIIEIVTEKIDVTTISQIGANQHAPMLFSSDTSNAFLTV